MAEPPEFWVFAVANLIILLFGSVLTVLSYLAYQRHPTKTSFQIAAIGFAFITVGGMMEPIYQLGIKQTYQLTGRELLAIQGFEGLLIASGLGLLFYSIQNYNRSAPELDPTDSSEQNESR